MDSRDLTQFKRFSGKHHDLLGHLVDPLYPFLIKANKGASPLAQHEQEQALGAQPWLPEFDLWNPPKKS